jgi:Xaa-Pro aminopeptidase
MMSEARARWEMLNLIRREKFDIVLPKAMRENQIDMWIHVMREGNPDPLALDLGGDSGHFIFTDRGGDRIERAVLGGGGYTVRNSGAYDIFGSADDLREFVTERDPKRIAVNMSERLAVADGLSHTGYLRLVETLGEKYAERLVSAEKLIADFRSRRVDSEIVAFANACEITRQILERALSNEVITPGVTTLNDVAWWIKEQRLARGWGATLRLPPVFIRYPDGHEIASNEHVIQGGDLLQIDGSVGLMNLQTDIKRIAYVLREGEMAVPPEIQNAFDMALKVREIIRKNIKLGRTGTETLEILYNKVEEAGFVRMEVEDQMTDPDNIEVNIGCHSVGNLAHCAGPAIWIERPWRSQFTIQPTHLLAFEFNTYVPVPEWERGEKVYIALEDDVIVTENRVQWLYPPNSRILLIG